jgi:hypothetical protein
VELRVSTDEVRVFTAGPHPEHLATHPRARTKGSWVVDPRHWDGLPDGTGRGRGPAPSAPAAEPDPEADQLARMIVRVAAAGIDVARRDPATYDRAFAIAGGER